jgi:hypothetical protein
MSAVLFATLCVSVQEGLRTANGLGELRRLCQGDSKPPTTHSAAPCTPITLVMAQEDDWLCPICRELLFKPAVNSACGHVYCHWCLHKVAWPLPLLLPPMPLQAAWPLLPGTARPGWLWLTDAVGNPSTCRPCRHTHPPPARCAARAMATCQQ